ncbi:MAG: hypothetical protein ABSD81_02810 [Methanomicrobiales archaeon]|jgi:hypothetical protein
MNIAFVIIGILCIIALYSVPVPVYPPPTIPSIVASSPLCGKTTNQIYLPISTLANSISDPLLVGGLLCGIIVGGPTYQLYNGLFYAGWIVGAICIIYGLSR